MKYVIKQNKNENDEIVELSLEEYGDDIILEANGWQLLKITPDGEIITIADVEGDDIGIKTDKNGEVEIYCGGDPE